MVWISSLRLKGKAEIQTTPTTFENWQQYDLTSIRLLDVKQVLFI